MLQKTFIFYFSFWVSSYEYYVPLQFFNFYILELNYIIKWLYLSLGLKGLRGLL